MKILIWTSSYPPVMGGLQTVTSLLAKGLSVQGHQVLVLTNRFSKSHPETEVNKNLVVKRIRHWQPSLTERTLKGYLLFLSGTIMFHYKKRRIGKVIKDFKPDVVNIHFPDSQLPYWKGLQNSFRVSRMVVSLHGHEITRWFETDDEQVSNRLLSDLTRKEIRQLAMLVSLLSNAHAVTACSKWLLHKAYALGFDQSGKTCQEVYNAVSLKRYEVVYENPFPVKYIFAFGRLEYHKGFDLLIEAFASITTRYNEMKLVIGGEGKYRSELEQLTKRLGISRVVFVGGLMPEEVVKYTQHSEVVVIPSRREPFGITVLEALASRRSVVATDIGGIPEAGGKFVKLAEPTVKALEEKIIEVLESDGEANAEELTKYLDQFSLDNFMKNFETLLCAR